MAIDTRDKRMSMIALAFPSGRVLPHRDGDITQEDFEQFLYLYRGVQSSDLPVPTLQKIILATLLFQTTNQSRLRFFPTILDEPDFALSQERFSTFNRGSSRGIYF